MFWVEAGQKKIIERDYLLMYRLSAGFGANFAVPYIRANNSSSVSGCSSPSVLLRASTTCSMLVTSLFKLRVFCTFVGR
jgi:hypothetical protein